MRQDISLVLLIAHNFSLQLENWMRDEVKFNYNYDTNGSNPITATWDRMQTKVNKIIVTEVGKQTERYMK